MKRHTVYKMSCCCRAFFCRTTQDRNILKKVGGSKDYDEVDHHPVHTLNAVSNGHYQEEIVSALALPTLENDHKRDGPVHTLTVDPNTYNTAGTVSTSTLPSLLNNNVDDEKMQNKMQKLSTAIPEATEAERRRFLIARKGDYEGALSQLQSYIEWRKECHLDEEGEILSESSSMPDDFMSCASSVGGQDRADWDNAASAAVNFCKEKRGNGTKNENNFEEKHLPQLAYMVTEIGSEIYMTDKQGDRIVQLLPAQIDVKEADETTYALAIAFYLDKKLSRNSMENIVVTVDVRAGAGWANPPATVRNILFHFIFIEVECFVQFLSK